MVGGLVVHEFGHQLLQDLRTTRGATAELQSRVSSVLGRPYDLSVPHGDTMRGLIQAKLSMYGATNPAEMVAEAFTEYRLSSEPRALPRAVGDVIDHYLEGPL